MTNGAESGFPKNDLLRMTAEIVSAYVSHHEVPAVQISEIIKAVHSSLDSLQHLGPFQVETTARPAIAVRKSITPDYLICLDDGKRFKSLRRHLGVLGLTPEQYREKWKLPSDYPMVAPNYAAQRSTLAKKIGLGQKRKAG